MRRIVPDIDKEIANDMFPAQFHECSQHELVAGSASLSYDVQSKRKGACPHTRRPPTSYQALQAIRVVIKYAEPRLELPQDDNFFIQLGRIEEKLERHQRVFTDICAQTGLHSVNRE